MYKFFRYFFFPYTKNNNKKNKNNVNIEINNEIINIAIDLGYYENAYIAPSVHKQIVNALKTNFSTRLFSDSTLDIISSGETIDKLDKSVSNGYSLVGDFVKSGDFDESYSDGLYLDCNKEPGKKKKLQTDYRLFRISNGELRLLDMIIDGESNWACEFWDTIEEEL